MKVSKPEDIIPNYETVSKLVFEFEQKLKSEDPDDNFFHLVILGEYQREALDKIEKLYSDAGWINVRCVTSSENGERPGLTSLRFYRP